MERFAGQFAGSNKMGHGCEPCWACSEPQPRNGCLRNTDSLSIGDRGVSRIGYPWSCQFLGWQRLLSTSQECAVQDRCSHHRYNNILNGFGKNSEGFQESVSFSFTALLNNLRSHRLSDSNRLIRPTSVYYVTGRFSGVPASLSCISLRVGPIPSSSLSTGITTGRSGFACDNSAFVILSHNSIIL